MKNEIGKTEPANELVKMPPLTAVVAMALNRVIGVGDKLPWHIPDELKWFKNLTMGHLLLMGRKTFESIGKPLPGRTIVVLSKSGFKHPDVITISDLAELPKVANNQKILRLWGCIDLQTYSAMVVGYICLTYQNNDSWGRHNAPLRKHV